MKKKKNDLVIELPTTDIGGVVRLFRDKDEVVWSNPRAGKRLRDKDLLFVTRTPTENVPYVFWTKGKTRVHVHLTLGDLERLLVEARRSTKMRKAWGKKKGRKTYGFWKNLGNLTFFFKEEN